VVTSVARDDLADGGAAHFARTIRAARAACGDDLTVEVLTPDFGGSREALETVLAARPDVFNHNIETVRRLTLTVRHRATYERTLDVLRMAREIAQVMTARCAVRAADTDSARPTETVSKPCCERVGQRRTGFQARSPNGCGHPFYGGDARFETNSTVAPYRKANGARTIFIKSGFMLGLGETEAEVLETMRDLRDAGCELLTIGQYLQPTRASLPVAEFVRPEMFVHYRRAGLTMGYRHVASAPMVRSSYHADDFRPERPVSDVTRQDHDEEDR